MAAVSGGRKRLEVLCSSGGHNVDVLEKVMDAHQPAGSSPDPLHKSVTSLETQRIVQICLRKQKIASLFSALYVWYA